MPPCLAYDSGVHKTCMPPIPHVLYTTPVEYLVSIRQCGSLQLLFDREKSRWSVALYNMWECRLAIVPSILQKNIGEAMHFVYAMRIRYIDVGVVVGTQPAFRGTSR